jgi:hypothetical protein
MPKLGDKPNMAEKHREVRKLLDQTPEAEIHITYLPGGRARVDFIPHYPDTPEEMARWKEALDEAEGMWEDREDIEAERKAIRQELDRSYPANDDTKTS